MKRRQKKDIREKEKFLNEKLKENIKKFNAESKT
jgi:hypothetical protein